MSKINVGKVSPVPKGNWGGANAAYEKLNMVNYNGVLYIAKQDIAANSNIAITNTNYWMKATNNWGIGTVNTINDSTASASASVSEGSSTNLINLTIPRGAFNTEIIDDNAGNGDTTHVWSADRESIIAGGIDIANSIAVNGSYQITVDDLESGVWNFASKAPNSNILRLKYLVPVSKGTVIEYSCAGYKTYIGVLNNPTDASSSAYRENFYWQSDPIPAGVTLATKLNYDGWLVFLIKSTVDIQPSDFTGTVKIYSPSQFDLLHPPMENIYRYMYISREQTRVYDEYIDSTVVSTKPTSLAGLYCAYITDPNYYVCYVLKKTGYHKIVGSKNTGEFINKIIFNAKPDGEYAFDIIKKDHTVITVEEARSIFHLEPYDPKELSVYDEYNGAKDIKLDFYKGCMISYTDVQYSNFGTSLYGETSNITDVYKMPEGGIQVSVNEKSGSYSVFFYKIDNGLLVPDYDYAFNGYNPNAGTNRVYIGKTVYFPYAEDLYFQVAFFTSNLDELSQCKIGFGNIDNNQTKRLTNLQPIRIVKGTIPGSSITNEHYPTFAIYPYDGSFLTQVYKVSILRLQDVKAVSCSPAYGMVAYIYDNDDNLLGYTKFKDTDIYISGKNYIDFTEYGKEGYVLLVIHKLPTCERPDDGVDTPKYKQYYNGGLGSYDEIYDNVYVEYYGDVNIQRAINKHPKLAHNIRAIKNMRLGKMFEFDYANGHNNNFRMHLYEENNTSPTLYGGASFYNTPLNNVSAKSYVTAMQNFNSEIYKSDWTIDANLDDNVGVSVWDNYGWVCNSLVSVMCGFDFESITEAFYLESEDSYLGMTLLKNWDYQYEYDKIKPGDWLVVHYYDNDNSRWIDHLILATDVVYINGEIFCIETMDGYAPFSRFRPMFVNGPYKKYNLMYQLDGITVVAQPDPKAIRTLEEAYGSLDTNYTVGNLMCNRGTDSVYGYSNKHCYITIDDTEEERIQTIDIYKDDTFVKTVTVPAFEDRIVFQRPAIIQGGVVIREAGVPHPLRAIDIITDLRESGSGHYTLIPDNKETVQESFFFAPNYSISYTTPTSDTKMFTLEHKDEVAYVLASYREPGNGPYHRFSHLASEITNAGNITVPNKRTWTNGAECTLARFYVIYKTDGYGTYILRKSLEDGKLCIGSDEYFDSNAYINN